MTDLVNMIRNQALIPRPYPVVEVLMSAESVARLAKDVKGSDSTLVSVESNLAILTLADTPGPVSLAVRLVSGWVGEVITFHNAEQARQYAEETA